MADIYVLGDTAKVTVEFRDNADALFDPTIVALTYEAPDATTTTVPDNDPLIVRDSLGLYHSLISADQAGAWYYRWVGDTTSTAEGTFYVEASAIGAGALRNATRQLERMVAYDTDPVLDAEDIDRLVIAARRPDTDGLIHSDTDWVPTYDLNTAAAAGWRLKAALAAGRYDFGEDGQRFDRSQIQEQCLAMARVYARGSVSSVALVSAQPSLVSEDYYPC